MIQPLSVFAAEDLLNSPNAVGVRESLIGSTPQGELDRIVSYLRSGEMVLAWMENTRDLVGDKFSVPGGSSILCDGRFFWRLDTADYVETYSMWLPDSFIAVSYTHLTLPTNREV